MTEKIYELAEKIQENMEHEAEAIGYYTEILKETHNYMPDYVKEVIEEIISDELNHQEKLFNCYCKLTAIEPAKDGVEDTLLEDKKEVYNDT